MMRVIDELMWRLDGMHELIDQYVFCQERQFLTSDRVDDSPNSSDVPTLNTVEQAKRRRVVLKALENLERLDRELDPLREMLQDYMAEQVR